MGRKKKGSPGKRTPLSSRKAKKEARGGAAIDVVRQIVGVL